MTVLYNEFDKNAAAWLRELISMGAIADGYVDQRSILELTPSDIGKYRCAHFFAGIGGWSYALRLAGIPDDYPVWTASLPCQPFSCAGKQLGKNDERHLLPHFLELVRECRPNIIFGEQVEGAIRHGWLDDLQTTMEREGYAVGHCVLGAHSVGAPHIRQRLYWVAVSESKRGMRASRAEFGAVGRQEGADLHIGIGASEIPYGIAPAESIGLERRGGEDSSGDHSRIREDGERFGHRNSGGSDDRLANAANGGRQSIQNLQSAGVLREALQQTEQREQSGDLRTAFSGLANSGGTGLQEQHGIGRISPSENGNDEGQDATGSFGMGDSRSQSSERNPGTVSRKEAKIHRKNREVNGGMRIGFGNAGEVGGMGDTAVYGYSPYLLRKTVEQSKNESRLLQFERPDSHWSDCDWLYCRDGKYRPIKSGLAPLVGKFKPSSIEMADGLPRGMVHSGDSSIPPNETAEARAMRLKGYGNAIVPQTAAEFIKAVFEALDLY